MATLTLRSVKGSELTHPEMDANFTNLNTDIAGRATTVHQHSAADITSGTLGLARGGTGGTDAATARTALGAASQAALTSAVNTMAASTKTASYTLALVDAGTVVEMNVAAANTVTVPPNSSVAFPTGTVVEVNQIGTGQTTIVAGAGVTLRASSTLVLRAQWASVSLRKRATDEWVVQGDTT